MRAHHLPPRDSQALSAEYLSEQDCVLIATDHKACDQDFIDRHARLLVDKRNATAGVVSGGEKIVKA